MVRKVHGQSEYTPVKHAHLQAFLDGGTRGWQTQGWRNPYSRLIVVDCTAGCGQSDNGQPGSPLILNQHFQRHFGGDFCQLCCERDPDNFEKLLHLPLVECELVNGDYRQILPDWLGRFGVDLSSYRLNDWRFHGLIYVDPNGMIDALNGLPLFQFLQEFAPTRHVDLLFNISLNAYKRHHGRYRSRQEPAHAWAKDELISHLDTLAKLKKCAFVRTEVGQREWIMLHLLNTDKVRLTRRTYQIVPYSEWRENIESYLNGGPKISPYQTRLFDDK